MSERATNAWSVRNFPEPQVLGDPRCYELVNAYRGGTEAERTDMMEKLVPERCDRLLRYCEEMSALATRDRRVDALEAGILALALIELRPGVRPVLDALHGLRQAATQLGFDAEPLFLWAAGYARQDMATLLRRFAARDAGGRIV
jgi:hypothetical protein